MSRPVQIDWPVPDVVAVCLTQQPLAAGPFIIDGTLASTDDSVARYATFLNIERTVSITSGGDVSGTQFTITGTLQGATVSETITGPNAATIETAQTFNTVTSVTVDNAPAATARVGTGTTGASIWFLNDYQRTQCAVGIYVGVAPNLTYSLESTYDNPAFVPTPQGFAPVDGVTTPTIPAATPMLHATASILTNLTIPVFASRVLVEASDATGQAVFYFLQQGIK